jgi:hypothetical protein
MLPRMLRPHEAGMLTEPRTTIDSFEFNDLPDFILREWLTATGHRHNVLITCANAAAAKRAMRHLTTWCPLPFRYCALPGRVEFRATRRGTLVLNDIAAMTRSQQVRLFNWLSVGTGDVRIISITSAPLEELVENGEFLEGLFYRLNVIRLDAMQGTRRAPLVAWQQNTCDATA